ncbi:MAG: permease-like cell division protein FtsX [Patescibacteria group bacterium]
MFTNFSRIIKYGFVGFWRNGWLSAATIAIMFLVLVGFGCLLIFSSVTNIFISDIQDKIDISAYFKTDAPEDEILKIKKALESLTEVKSIEYISRDEALKIFKLQHQADDTVSQALEELSVNPLSASLNIKARELKDYSVIASYLGKEDFKNFISKVSYTQNVKVIDRLKRIKGIVEQGGFVMIVFISLIAALIIFNTIRLAIYSNREEIGIMRLVGGSNFFIRGPYLIEGMLYGFISGVLSVGIISLLVYYAAPYLKIFVPGINGWGYYTARLSGFFMWQLAFGIGLGIISSYIAVRKYLKI